jgi:hypothetical protein
MKSIEVSQKNAKKHQFSKEENNSNNSPQLNLARGKGSHNSL